MIPDSPILLAVAVALSVAALLISIFIGIEVINLLREVVRQAAAGRLRRREARRPEPSGSRRRGTIRDRATVERLIDYFEEEDREGTSGRGM